MTWYLLVVTTFAVARVTRFIVSDDLWKELREAIVVRLQDPRIFAHQDRQPGPDSVEFKSRRVFYLHEKLATLITCPWCVSIYVAAAVLALTRVFVVDSIIAPVWVWLGVSMAATLLIEITDGVKQVQTVVPPKHDSH